MKPEELYRLIQQKLGLKETTICKLHKPCSSNPQCNPAQHSLMLNFDEVERLWHMQAHRESTKSVDAITYTDKTFCLIEMKGWLLFLENKKTARNLQPSDKEKNRLNQQIQKNTSSYNLQSKFIESVQICQEISEMNDISQDMCLAYILVTDVDPKKNAVNSLVSALNMLAQTSTDWEKVCADSLGTHFQLQTSCLKSVKTRYVYCKNLDLNLAKL